MLELILLLLLSILIVFISALLFVNAIEFLGSQYKIGGAFVGSILSPLFTSLPELIVLIIAVFGLGGVSGEAVGVGTIFGEPLMASSLSYGLVGMLAYVGYRLRRREHQNSPGRYLIGCAFYLRYHSVSPNLNTLSSQQWRC